MSKQYKIEWDPGAAWGYAETGVIQLDDLGKSVFFTWESDIGQEPQVHVVVLNKSVDSEKIWDTWFNESDDHSLSAICRLDSTAVPLRAPLSAVHQANPCYPPSKLPQSTRLKLMKKYHIAHRNGCIQTAFELLRGAKKGGLF